MRSIRRILFILAIAELVGCSQLPTDLKSALSPTEPHAERKTMKSTDADAVVAKEHSDAPRQNIGQIIRLLEDGKQDEARRALKEFRANDPKNPVALSLQQQLEADPVKMLGKKARNYTVASGDTLGGLAERFLGNPLKFVILARYNHINRTKDLRVGQVLRIPTGPQHEEAPSETTEQTVQSDTPTPAPVDSAPAKIEEKPGTPEKPIVTAPESPSMKDATTLAQVRKYHEQALLAYRRQDLDQAIALWNKALALDPTYEPALGYRARALELRKRLDQLGGDSTH